MPAFPSERGPVCLSLLYDSSSECSELFSVTASALLMKSTGKQYRLKGAEHSTDTLWFYYCIFKQHTTLHPKIHIINTCGCGFVLKCSGIFFSFTVIVL